MAIGTRITLISRAFVGGIFLLAGLGKIFAPVSFAEIISDYQIIPEALAWPLAFYLPCLECVLGGLLIANISTRACCYLTLFLLALFTLALAQAWIRGIDLRCGCFGVLGDWGDYPIRLARNTVLSFATWHVLTKTTSERQEKAGKKPSS